MVAQKRHHLTDMQVQMARELGFKPDSLRKIDNHKQEVMESAFTSAYPKNLI